MKDSSNASDRKLRVRTGRTYSIPFGIDLGQHNAEFVKRPLNPLCNALVLRFFPWLRATDAMTIVGPGYDLIHSKNSIPIWPNTPFIITFEDYLPRVPEDRYIGWLEAWLQRRLAIDRCVAILAESDYALRQFRWQNRNFCGLPKLEAKMQVLYPSAPVHHEIPKKVSSSLKLLFVGTDFLRKGGPAVVRAHERLKRARIPVTTTVISSLRWSEDDYIGPPSVAVASAEHERLLRSDINIVRSMPNLEVLTTMRDSDFLLLPTFHDTFGYVSIEALACGTPVIATNNCAQPEVVEDGVCGFLLPFQKDPIVGKWVWTYRTSDPGYVEAFVSELERLGKEIADRLMEFWEDSGRYEEMSANCLQRVRERFDRDKARNRLEALYEKCRGPLR